MSALDLPPVSFGILKSLFWNKLEKKLCKPTLQKSDLIYRERHYCHNFIKMTDNLAIDFILKNAFSNERRPFAQLILRNIGESKITKLDISVRTNSVHGRKCENRFNVYDLSSTEEEELNLTNIPLVEIYTDEESEGFYKSHGRLNVKIHSIEIDGVTTNNPEHENVSLITSKFSALLNNEWVSKWDYKWNIDWIRLSQRRLAERLYYTDNFMLKLLSRNKRVIITLFWLLIFNKVEFDKNGFTIE